MTYSSQVVNEIVAWLLTRYPMAFQWCQLVEPPPLLIVDHRMSAELPPLPVEQLLIDELPSLTGERALVVSPGRAQIARHLQQERHFPEVTAWFLDLYQAAMAGTSAPESVDIACSADLPMAEVDVVVMPVLKKAEAELTRDLLQQAHARLVDGGWLAVAVDNPRDQWLHQQMQALFPKVTSSRSQRGCAYWAQKTEPLKKVKDFTCQFAFRDDQQMIQVLSRPGVFSHRRLDPGARQLILSAEIGPADSVLDMGCGAGSVALASAFKTQGVVLGVDSNARAVECLERGAELNGLPHVQAQLNADGQLSLENPVDIALANPPYFGDDRISKHFVDTCVAALRPGGAVLVVTKQPSWYEAYFQTMLEDIVIFEASKYFVACGRKI